MSIISDARHTQGTSVMNSVILIVARIMLAAIFILAGLEKFSNIPGTAGYIESAGLPLDAAGDLPMSTILAWATAICEVVAGAALIVGFQTRLVSWLLAIFCVASAALFHYNFGDQLQSILFMKNIAMAGGFLALTVAGPGSLSLDTYRRNRSA